MQSTMIDDVQGAKEFLLARRKRYGVTNMPLCCWLRHGDLRSRCLSTAIHYYPTHSCCAGKCVRNSIVADIFALPRLSTDRIDQKPVPGKATDCSPQIVITVTPDQRPGRYRTYIETEPKPLSVSRQPFLDGARELLERGHDPRTMLVMRWVGAEDWALRGSLGLAARLTVDEHNGVFAKWKPYSRSAVPPGNANSAKTVPNGRAGKKPIPESTAEKAGEQTGLDSTHHYV